MAAAAAFQVPRSKATLSCQTDCNICRQPTACHDVLQGWSQPGSGISQRVLAVPGVCGHQDVLNWPFRGPRHGTHGVLLSREQACAAHVCNRLC